VSRPSGAGRQGRIEDAEQLLAGLTADAETVHPLAAVHLARGEAALAVEALERGLAHIPPDSASAGPLLMLLVDVQLAAGRVADAAVVAERLSAIAARHLRPVPDRVRGAGAG